MSYKIREFPESNYRGIYFNGKTMRIALDPSKPILDLEYPEFYDIKLTNNCRGGCSYCYQDSTGGCQCADEHALKRLTEFFESMTPSQRPFQVAYGGGEPTSHKDFREILEVTRRYGIAPNYTTNGMFNDNTSLRSSIITATRLFCEGVAISCHEHLSACWEPCARRFVDEGIFTNFHNIISDAESINTFFDIYSKWKGKIKYFVLLPMMNMGRAKGERFEPKLLFDILADMADNGVDISDIAFGANFFPYLKDVKFLNLSLYEPEIMSKYLDITTGNVYNSSFDTGEPLRNIL